jgi:hypothetical protein
VVNGYLSAALRPQLEQHFERIVTRDVARFAEELEDAVQGMMRQLDVRTREATLARVNEQLDRVVRQNSALQAAFDQFAREHRATDTYSQAAEAGLRRVFGQLGGAQSDEMPAMFSRTRAVFDSALRRLDSSAEPIDELFLLRPPTRRPGTRLAAQLTSSPEMLTGAACANLLRSITLSFRRGIVVQLNSVRGYQTQDFVGDVADLCKMMESVVESPGVRQLASGLDKWARSTNPLKDDRALIDLLRQMPADVHHSIMRDLDDLTGA